MHPRVGAELRVTPGSRSHDLTQLSVPAGRVPSPLGTAGPVRLIPLAGAPRAPAIGLSAGAVPRSFAIAHGSRADRPRCGGARLPSRPTTERGWPDHERTCARPGPGPPAPGVPARRRGVRGAVGGAGGRRPGPRRAADRAGSRFAGSHPGSTAARAGCGVAGAARARTGRSRRPGTGFGPADALAGPPGRATRAARPLGRPAPGGRGRPRRARHAGDPPGRRRPGHRGRFTAVRAVRGATAGSTRTRPDVHGAHSGVVRSGRRPAAGSGAGGRRSYTRGSPAAGVDARRHPAPGPGGGTGRSRPRTPRCGGPTGWSAYWTGTAAVTWSAGPPARTARSGPAWPPPIRATCGAASAPCCAADVQARADVRGGTATRGRRSPARPRPRPPRPPR